MNLAVSATEIPAVSDDLQGMARPAHQSSHCCHQQANSILVSVVSPPNQAVHLGAALVCAHVSVCHACRCDECAHL